MNQKLTALYNKALSFLYENKLDDAIKAFEEPRPFAEKQNQPAAVVLSYAYQAYALCEMGKASNGVTKYEEAIATMGNVELTPRQKENLQVYSNNWLAYCYAMNNQLDKAITSADLFKKDVEARDNPGEKEALEQTLALIDFKAGNYDAAIDRFSKLQPNPGVMVYQGQALMKKGDKEAARNLFTKISNWNQNSQDLAVVWNRTRKELGK